MTKKIMSWNWFTLFAVSQIYTYNSTNSNYKGSSDKFSNLIMTLSLMISGTWRKLRYSFWFIPFLTVVCMTDLMISLCNVQALYILYKTLFLQAAADDILTMLWHLMEAGQEELKLLQTAILLITTNFVVQHESLAKVRNN